ncbi:MAG: GatB/YqeY domain-containing protein [Oscillospiraceae bacterium]|nr:GatB/YqeY domain-containing protein [Oscillospiraceae bacterium]
MSKIDLVRAEMMKSLKEKNMPRKEALSLLLSALKAKFIDKREELTEAEENAIVMKEIRQVRETLETADNRQDLIDECNLKIAIYSEFAPQLMSESEIEKMINETLINLKISDPVAKDKGLIMKNLPAELKAHADMRLVNKIVENLLK